MRRCKAEEEGQQCPNPSRALGFCIKHHRRFKAHGDPLGAAPGAKTECSVEGCERGGKIALGYCMTHYQRFKKWGDPLYVESQKITDPLPGCTHKGCDRPARNHTSPHCETHYTRSRRHGSPDVAKVDHTPAVERWKTSYSVDEVTGCWVWTKAQDGYGYGVISDGAGNRYQAHRFVWTQVVGPIESDLTLDHHSPFGCGNKLCVNPEHLEAVPQAINALRGEVNAAKTHCDHGHEFTEANTYVRSNGWRQCRACARRIMRTGKYRQKYVYLYRPNHPIADKSQKVMEHRMVLFDAIGLGPHACHWRCGRVVGWGGITGIHVDHLNGDPSDNRLENLVPSCQSCNKGRAKRGNPIDWQGVLDSTA